MSRDPSIVSKNMSKIHSKDTSIELLLRKALWHKGYRYRKFFHGKDWDSLKTRLEKGKNPEFWINKIERNRNRDYENDKKLLFLGYTVIHFWGQDIIKHTDECIQAIEESIWNTELESSVILELDK